MHCLFKSATVRGGVKSLAGGITSRYLRKYPSIIALDSGNGSLYFAHNLTQKIKLPNLRMSRLPVRSDAISSSGIPGIEIGALDEAVIVDRDIVLVNEVLESGRTLSAAIESLKAHGARSVEVCVLVAKRKMQVVPITPAFCAFSVDDVWLAGYGLDYKGAYLNLPYLGVPKEVMRDRKVAPRGFRWMTDNGEMW